MVQVHPGIRISSIPVEGGGGLIVALGMAVLVLVAVPELAPLALISILGGALLAPLLHRAYY